MNELLCTPMKVINFVETTFLTFDRENLPSTVPTKKYLFLAIWCNLRVALLSFSVFYSALSLIVHENRISC